MSATKEIIENPLKNRIIFRVSFLNNQIERFTLLVEGMLKNIVTKTDKNVRTF